MTPLGQRLARAMYALLLRLALPLYLARLWRRGAREPEYRRAWGERLGWYGARVAPGALWVHAVSLGETRAAAALVDALREREPGLRLLLTHGTATGRQAGRALLRDGDLQAWLPYDTPGAARRFLRNYRPRVGVQMETELWPALMREAERVGVPVVLANARLSERSARRGRRLAALVRLRERRLKRFDVSWRMHTRDRLPLGRMALRGDRTAYSLEHQAPLADGPDVRRGPRAVRGKAWKGA